MSFQNARKLVDKLFSFIESRDISLPEARVIVSSCIYHILRTAYDNNIRINFILPEEMSDELSLADLKTRLREYFRK